MRSRRSFLKSALAGLAALTVFGAQPSLEVVALPEAWGPKIAAAQAEAAFKLIRAFLDDIGLPNHLREDHLKSEAMDP